MSTAGDELSAQALLREAWVRDCTATAYLAASARLGVAPHNALHEAAARGEVTIAEALLQALPAAVNARDSSGWTPLHYAVHGRAACCELLIARGADVGAVNHLGMTPLELGARGHISEQLVVPCLAQLVNAGAGTRAASTLATAAGRLVVASFLEPFTASAARWAGLRRAALTLWCVGRRSE